MAKQLEYDFYVNMVDRFLSGWGEARHGRSLLSIGCHTHKQAEAIEAAARKRGEMRYITIAAAPPRPRRGDVLSIKRFEEMGGPWLQFWRGGEK